MQSVFSWTHNRSEWVAVIATPDVEAAGAPERSVCEILSEIESKQRRYGAQTENIGRLNVESLILFIIFNKCDFAAVFCYEIDTNQVRSLTRCE